MVSDTFAPSSARMHRHASSSFELTGLLVFQRQNWRRGPTRQSRRREGCDRMTEHTTNPNESCPGFVVSLPQGTAPIDILRSASAFEMDPGS